MPGLWTIADLHLSGSATTKPMSVYGGRWQSHREKIEKRWKVLVEEGDTVVIPGDTSWSMKLSDAGEDLKFIDSLPGRKIIGKGNHDYWWSSVTKMKHKLAEWNIGSIDFLFNNSYTANGQIICGTRGWFYDEVTQNSAFSEADFQKITEREYNRLKISLDSAPGNGSGALVFLHFPPVCPGFTARNIIDLLHERNVTKVYCGHIHGNYSLPPKLEFEGITVNLVSSDYLDFYPMKIV